MGEKRNKCMANLNPISVIILNVQGLKVQLKNKCFQTRLKKTKSNYITKDTP